MPLDLPAEVWIGAFYALIFFVIAGHRYYESRWKAPRSSTASAFTVGVGAGIQDRDQMERLIEQVKRIADALTDKNTAMMSDRLDHMAEAIDGIRKRSDDLLGQLGETPKGRR